MPGYLLPLVIVVHVALAITLFVPSLLLPFALRRRTRAGADEAPRRATRILLGLQARGTLPLGIGLALTGLALVALVGLSLLARPWLLVALGIYAFDLALAFFVQRPGLRRLMRLEPRRDDPTAVAGARRQRYLSYVMTGLIGAIGFVMSTKPNLW
jgi:hypothetical protein